MATPKNDSFRVNAGKALDDKFLKQGRFAYVSKTEANNLVPVAERHPGLAVLIGDQVHTWAQGTADTDLMPLNMFFRIFNGEGFYTLKAGNWLQGFAVKVGQGGSDIASLRVGTTNGGDQLTPGGIKITASGNLWEPIVTNYLSDVDQNFFFSGFSGQLLLRIFKL